MRSFFLRFFVHLPRAFLLLQGLIFLLCYKKEKDVPHQEISLFLDSDSINSIFLSSLSSASNRIYAELFRLTDPLALRTLQRKKLSGVSVDLLLDSQCKPQNKAFISRGFSVQYDKPSGLMHRKVIVIDDYTSWIGSFNITRTGFYLQKNAFLRIRNKEVAAFLQQSKSKTKIFQLGSSSLQLWKIPPGKDALKELREAIQKSKQSIRALLFVCSHPKIIEDLIAAHQRGVTIDLVLDQGHSQNSSKKAILCLLQAGIQPCIYRGSQDLHHKFAWIDEEIIFLGSCNWSKSGFSKNREILSKLITQEDHIIRKIKMLWKECSSHIYVIC